MATHNPVTTAFAGPNSTTTIHFHCPCGTNRRELIINGPDNLSPVSRFTAAIRRLHEQGRWPVADLELGAAQDDGWGAPRNETAA